MERVRHWRDPASRMQASRAGFDNLTAENMSNVLKPLMLRLRENASQIWGRALFVWLVALCVVPDPSQLASEIGLTEGN